MSGWHREHPELTGTSADPWMALPSYRRIVAPESPERDEGERRAELLDRFGNDFDPDDPEAP